MATAKPAKTKDVKYEDITIPRGDKNDPNYFVSVNGVNYILPRGKKSSVPDFVAAEIRRSWRAQEALDDKIDEQLEQQAGWQPNIPGAK